jgi:CarD family transcriptional regulator
MSFKIGDMVAHPMHGAGIIDSIEVQKIDGVLREYYVMVMPVGDMLVKIPKDTCEEIGVRKIMDREEAEKILNAMPEIDSLMSSNWNQRYRDNMLKIKSGDLTEVASVVKGLMARDQNRGLSNGERKMLHTAKQIFISEIALSTGLTYSEVEGKISASIA